MNLTLSSAGLTVKTSTSIARTHRQRKICLLVAERWWYENVFGRNVKKERHFDG